MLWQKIDADYHERLAKKRELAAASSDGVVDRGLGASMSSNVNVSQDPEDPSAQVRDRAPCTAPASHLATLSWALVVHLPERAHSSGVLCVILWWSCRRLERTLRRWTIRWAGCMSTSPSTSTMRWIGSPIDHAQYCAVSYASQAFSAGIRVLGLPLLVREMGRSSDRVFVACCVVSSNVGTDHPTRAR